MTCNGAQSVTIVHPPPNEVTPNAACPLIGDPALSRGCLISQAPLGFQQGPIRTHPCGASAAGGWQGNANWGGALGHRGRKRQSAPWGTPPALAIPWPGLGGGARDAGPLQYAIRLPVARPRAIAWIRDARHPPPRQEPRGSRGNCQLGGGACNGIWNSARISAMSMIRKIHIPAAGCAWVMAPWGRWGA